MLVGGKKEIGNKSNLTGPLNWPTMRGLKLHWMDIFCTLDKRLSMWR